MWKRKLLIATVGCVMPVVAFTAPTTPPAEPKYYGKALCKNPKFTCQKLKNGKSWKARFPNERERDLIQRLNRSDTYLYTGRTLVIPKDLKNTTVFDISPFPLKIESPKEKMIIVDQNRLAWGAYNPAGELVKWGPISSGKDFCPDIKRSCRTISGIFYVFHKKGAGCKSNVFPVGRGGSNMPYCMFFFKGYALHGSNEVLGRRGSHGCVRLFTRDAKWLNHEFVDVATREGHLGTKVVVQRLVDK